MQVLFVLSADRPLTESEVRFLKYVRRWGKKVVFVVNKVRARKRYRAPLSLAALHANTCVRVAFVSL